MVDMLCLLMLMVMKPVIHIKYYQQVFMLL